MSIVDEASIDGLPDPVRRCLLHSGVLGTPVPTGVTVRQRGRIRTSRESRWLGFRAVETYGVEEPAFSWRAGLRIGGVTLGRATDSLSDGHGSMHVKLLGLFDVVDESGSGIDQGSAMRWLNETMWFPAVWATPTIRWEPIDETSAIGSVTTGETTVQAEFRFDETGRFVDFAADRLRGVDDAFEPTPWRTPITEHRSFDGLELPAAGTAEWLLDDGPFPYIDISVDDITYTH